ncbi:YncE family protein [Balneola sp. MJW-20]|uniref:YncE family protein n=1 Tax=Gracilimonas aurantiaca TaxID=3234185 RepID=UPI00346729B3
MRVLFLLLTSLLFSITSLNAQQYYVYVTAESEDEVSLIRFDAQSGEGEIVRDIEVGKYPAENDGPHGINVSADGEHIFVSIAHGNPYGYLQKIEAETGKLVAEAPLGMFPASMEVSSSTGFLYIVNFNLHGDMVPSTVSVIDPEIMEVITEIPTGIMPHGSRMNADGTRQYHVSMMTDELIEIDTELMEVSRRLPLGESSHSAMHAGMDQQSGMSMQKEMMHNPVEKPTWADPHPSKPLVYVAANGSSEILEIDTGKWEVTRRWDSGKAPYNLEVSHDGKLLVVSYKGEAATGIWDLESGKELAKIPNSRKITHGVAISSDNRYAFLSVEGIGGEAGSVDVIDLQKLERVDYIETGKQAGGIIFWKQES